MGILQNNFSENECLLEKQNLKCADLKLTYVLLKTWQFKI